MFRFIAIWIAALIAILGDGKIYADLAALSYAEEEKYTFEVLKKYPSDDERCKFISENKKAFKILEKIFEKLEATFSASPENELWIAEDVFSVTQILPIYKPFLKNQNIKIRLCAEDAVRFAKAWMVFVLLIEPLDEASDEEFNLALKNAQNSTIQFKNSYSNFLRSCIFEKEIKSQENERKFKNVTKPVWLGDQKLSIVDELFKLNEKGIGYNFPLFHEILDFLNKNKYVTSKQYNDLVYIYYFAIEN